MRKDAKMNGSILFVKDSRTLLFHAGDYQGKHPVIAKSSLGFYLRFLKEIKQLGLRKENSSVLDCNFATARELFLEMEPHINRKINQEIHRLLNSNPKVLVTPQAPVFSKEVESLLPGQPAPKKRLFGWLVSTARNSNAIAALRAYFVTPKTA